MAILYPILALIRGTINAPQTTNTAAMALTQ